MTTEALKNLTTEMFSLLVPKEKLSVTEFCKRHRYISEDVSPSAGLYNPEHTPYQTYIQDLYNDPEVEEIVCKMASQVGKSEMIYNLMFYSAINNPGAQMFVYPSKEAVKEDVVKLRIDPMLENNPILAEKFSLTGNNPKNTIMLKKYEGGYWKFVGANVSNDLAAKAVRDIFVDEHSRIAASVGNEGDPIQLAKRRQSNYKGSGRTFFFTSSSPTYLGECAISALYETSKRHVLELPCFHCGAYQQLLWDYVRWEESRPDTAYIECQHCGAAIRDEHKYEMLQKHRWQCLDPDKPRTRMGFHLSALYSSPIFYPLRSIVQNYFDGLLSPAKMQVFVNTDLAEEYKGDTSGIEGNHLMDSRRIHYPAEAPQGVLYVTCGIDPNGDFTAIECVGWGLDGKSWSLDYREIMGAPENKETFRRIEEYLYHKTFRHELGFKIPISCTFIDSGNWTDDVYDFVRKNEKNLRIFCSKGVSGFNKPILGKYTKKQTGRDRRKVKLFPIGVDAAKYQIYQALKVEDEDSPNYCYYPLGHDAYDQKYFTELVCERLTTTNVKGVVKTRWEKPQHIRNEPLDTRVLALCALKLVQPNFELQDKRYRAVANRMIDDNEQVAIVPESTMAQRRARQAQKRRIRGKSWVQS